MGKIYIGTDKISGVKIVSPPVNTADATITEADVLASKIAYGPNGRVVGTLVPLDTADATITEADVLASKIAYGPNGRVVGTLVPLDTSDATITAEDVLTSKIAYGPNGKVTGTLEVSQYYTGVQEPAESLGEPGDLYFLVEE